MPDQKTSIAPGKPVPASAEPHAAPRPRRVRLSKALAATRAKVLPGMTTLDRPARAAGTKADKPDRYTISRREHELLRSLKKRLRAMGATTSKGELLRAGLMLLTAMNDEELRLTAASTELGASLRGATQRN